MRSSQADVEKILNDIRLAIGLGRVQLIPRKKNLDTITQKGLTLRQVFNEIASMTFSNYIKGPEHDYDRPGDALWVFKLTLDGDRMYVKVKLLYTGDPNLKVISFHIDEP